MAEQKRITPGPLPISSRLQTVCYALMFIGLVAFAVMLMKDKDRAWYSYLTAYFFFFILTIGGLFFTAVQHLTRAGWSVNVRRFCEALVAWMPAAAVGAIVLLFGCHTLYEWFDKAKVASDELLLHKSGYLNPTFFILRTAGCFILWLLFAKKIIGYSTKQDQTGDDSLSDRAIPWSTGFLVFFAISFSFFGVDLIMSLEAHWFSTIFGVYLFGGLFQSTMAAIILLVMYCQRKGLLTGYVDENHMHDLGKFMFAFTVFWAYIAYSQYMLIWYANLPEETAFFIPRVTGAWTWESLALLTFRFIVPFLALLPRGAKRDPKMLGAISILILIMQYVDLHWLIYPNLNAQEVLLGLPEILIFAGFAGTYLFMVTRFLSKHPIVPLKDPRIHESLHHHVVY